jgi:spoIIIJ-associated protein
VQVEASGETVGEAKWAAVRELERMHPGLDKASVRFQVLSEGERGLLGVGYTPARVLAMVDESAAPGLEAASGPLAELVTEVLERVIAELDVEARVSIREDEDALVATLVGRELGRVIGRHGQTIDALQYLVNGIAQRAELEERLPVVIDAAGYRARRQAALDTLAVRTARRVAESGEEEELEPMTPVERKIVHVRLKDFPGVETRSEGTEPNRFVVVAPAGPDTD